MSIKKRGLGRNLGELLSLSMDSVAVAEAPETSLHFLPIEQLRRGQFQPRKDLDPTALAELAQSIKTQGILQPLVVRPIVGESQPYEIIAGERRWQAAKLAGLTEVPALIKHVGDEDTMALALIENMQRENLNAVEEAVAIARLVNDCELTQQQVADLLGKPRSTITNLLRILTLTEDARALLECGDLDLGHAKVLLALPEQQQSYAARSVVAKQLSVRETEQLVKRLLREDMNTITEPERSDPNITQLIQDLSERLGAKIDIRHQPRGHGKLTINYHSLDELDGILARIQ